MLPASRDAKGGHPRGSRFSGCSFCAHPRCRSQLPDCDETSDSVVVDPRIIAAGGTTCPDVLNSAGDIAWVPEGIPFEGKVYDVVGISDTALTWGGRN